MNLVKVVTMTVALIWIASVAWADADAILGIWTTEGAKSHVEIYKCGEKYCGKIISLKEPLYTDPKDGPVGLPKTDRKNKDAYRHQTPIIGLKIMDGFTPTGDNTWGNGTIYDPESGKTYRCNIKMTAPNRLKVRGFVGISLIGRTTVWTR